MCSSILKQHRKVLMKRKLVKGILHKNASFHSVESEKQEYDAKQVPLARL